MASKKTTTKKKVARKAQADVHLEDRLCAVALTIAADEGWAAVSLDRLATELEIPLGRVIAVCPTRTSLLSFLFKRVDNVVLNQVGSIDRSESVRGSYIRCPDDALRRASRKPGWVCQLDQSPDAASCCSFVPHS